MSNGLSVRNVVNVDIVLSPLAAQMRNFGSLLVLGDSDVLSPGEGLRRYTRAEDVGADFGVNSPEHESAVRFFSQRPSPRDLYFARWARTATRATLRGGTLSNEQRQMSNFTDIENGELVISINDTEQDITGIDLTGLSSLDEVAAQIQTMFTGDVELRWNESFGRFELKSGTSGTDSTVGFAIDSDVGRLLKLAEDQALPPVSGVESETLPQAVNRVADESADWYGLALAADDVDVDEVIEAAQIIEASNPSRIFAVTEMDSRALSASYDQDIASRVKAAGLGCTFVQYSSSDAFAAISAMARGFTVDFSGENTVITLKFKQEPGVVPETLNETQAKVLDNKNCNVFVRYANDTAILQQGVMGNGDFFDERHGLDWLQNYAQTNVYNVLYQSQTKVPQTDAGTSVLLTSVERSCAQAVRNGLLAPGVWNSTVEFGSLKYGDTLPKGYYAYAGPVAQQSQADREARKAPVMQVAAKLAGAVHFSDVIINVNR